jgi:probable F420-dependent oxidoreductase
MRPFRFGVNCTTTSAAEWLDTARKAEALGFDVYIAQDHFGAQLAPLSALAAAAMVTSRVGVGALVGDKDKPQPPHGFREAATLDVLSGGRMELGLGAGWLESDYLRTGIQFDPPGVRLERLAESLQICKLVLESETAVSFRGKHYCIDGLEPLPRPVQRPRPPVMAGGRLKRALQLAGREADIVSISLLDRRAADGSAPPTFSQKVAWVREAASERFASIQLHVNAAVVDISGLPTDAVAAFAARTAQTVEEALRSPGVLVGSEQAIVEKLHAMREEFGVNYWVAHARNMDVFSRAIARL